MLKIFCAGGFGHVLFNNLRQITALCQETNTTNMPLILGRDFAGTVVAKGNSATKFEIGDEVYGVLKPHDQGCHSEYTLATDSLVGFQTIISHKISISIHSHTFRRLLKNQTSYQRKKPVE